MVDEKVIFITGATSGIGLACTKETVAKGHKVSLFSRNSKRLKLIQDELGQQNVQVYSGDVRNADQQQEALNATCERFGRVDVVFANAGVGSSKFGTLEGDIDNFKDVIDVNIFGLTVTAKLALPYLLKVKGLLVFTGSTLGKKIDSGSVYGASKWFVRAYSMNIREELRGTGVRVTNLEPGLTDTGIFSERKTYGLVAEDVAKTFNWLIEQPTDISHPEIAIEKAY